LKRVEINQVNYFLNLNFDMKYFLIPILMLVSKIAMSQIMLPAYQGVVAKIPTVVVMSCPGLATVTDVDNNVYNTVLIGTQCWMASNLRVTKYNNGTVIPLNNTYTSGTVSTVWQGLRTGAYTIYGNEASSGTNATNYGFLYNWYAGKGIYKTGVIASTDTLNNCLIGWHVPTDTEWTTLTTYLGGESVAGGKMKSVGTSYWLSPNTGATNESGFSALPGGWRNYVGSFYSIKNDAFFWSATEYNGTNAWGRDLYDNNDNVYRDNTGNKSVGASVRCLKD
jgi:uncharacterized protein (TIGR02145 family)